MEGLGLKTIGRELEAARLGDGGIAGFVRGCAVTARFWDI
jgi:hypothetical protein